MISNDGLKSRRMAGIPQLQTSPAKRICEDAAKLRLAGKYQECCKHLLEGLKTFCHFDVDKFRYLAALSRVVPHLQFENGDRFKSVDIPYSPHLWAQVLSYLSSKEIMDWSAVRFLILGIRNDGHCPMEGIAADVATNGIEVGNLLTSLTDLKLKTWGLQLAISLLKKGADIKSLARDDGESPAVAAIRSAIRTGNPILMEYLVSTECSDDIKDIQDTEGRSLYHVVCESCPTGSSDICLRLCELLIKHNFNPVLLNKNGQTALDLVQPGSNLHASLSRGVQNFVDKLGKRMRRTGNIEYYKSNYSIAISKYKHAIEVINRTTRNNHELAMLHGNSTECYLKMSLPEYALRSSLLGVECRRDWYKAHWRLAKSYKSMNRDQEAVAAFIDSYNCLANSSDDKLKQEIICDLLETMTKYSTEAARHAVGKLRDLDKTMLAKMTYRLIQNRARVAETMFYSIQRFKGKITTEFDLRQLCDERLMRRWPWVAQFIELLIMHGSDYKAMRFIRYSDTYLHAGLRILMYTGNKSILVQLLGCAVSEKDLNMQDGYGNTILHLCAIYRMADANTFWPLNYLVDLGCNPCIKNNIEKLPIDYVHPSEQGLLCFLEEAMARVLDGQIKVNKPKIYVPERQPEPTRKQAQEKKQPTTRNERPQGNKKTGTVHCEKCDEIYEEGIKLLDKGEINKALKKFLGVLLWDHRSPRHQIIAEKCQKEIIDNMGRTPTPDLPYHLQKLSPTIMKMIVEKFGEKERWRHLEAAIKLYGTERLPKGFAKGISLFALISSKSLLGSESHRLEIMTMLQENGANLHVDKGKQSMQAAIDNNEVRVILRLLDEGVSPSVISVEDGDTPVHAALIIALDKDKGNFSFLDKLLKLYKSNGEKYAYLDPKRVNRLGDTLLHTACRCKYSRYSHKAVELLCNQQVPADILNKEGKMAIQYLTNRNDRRAQFLTVVEGIGAPSKSKSTEPQDTKQPSKDGTKQKQTMKNGSQESSPDRIEDETDIRVKTVNLLDVAMSRKRIKEILGERPDPQIPMYREGKTKDRFEPSLSKLKSDEGQAEEIADKRMGSPRKENRTVAERMLEGEEKVNQEKMEEEIDEDKEVEEEADITTITFDNMAWEVECTADVWKCLRDKHVLPELKRRAVCRIQYLAKGEWRPYLRKRINNVPPTLELYEAKLSKAARIIWEVAVAFSARCSEEAEKRLDVNEGQEFAVKGGRIYSEIIRVWDIVFDHDNLYRSIQNIIKSHSRGETCILKKKLKGVKDSQFEGGMTKRYPMLFAEQDDDLSLEAVRDRQQMLLYPPASANETEYHILKFYSFSTALVNIILQNIERKVDLPFRVTDKEHAIIHLRSKSPILLIGRSGTGKTTCCLYRLWTSFISYWVMARDVGEPFLPRAERFIKDKQYNDADCEDEDDEENDEEAQAIAVGAECDSLDKCLDEDDESEDSEGPDYDHLHQVFVTKNPFLCSEVHKNFYELCHAHAETKHYTQKETEDLPPRLQDIEDLSYPLFLTSKQLLLMLDASLDQPHFFDRNEDGSLGVRVQGWGSKDDLFNFSTLESDSDDEDEDEEDQYEESLDEDGNPIEQHAPARQQQKLDPRREVTYEVFAEEVWPKIVKKMSVNYHPSLVWTEIMSFIKGSFEALSKQDGHLTKDEYVELGRKRAPSFSGERDKVYELYKRYDHFKKQKFLFDESDLVQNIFRRLQAMTVQPWVFHQLYVDETQDFTQAELCVLLGLSQNPNDMFLTGDTAQGIMRGISFRFSDLRSLFFYARKSLHARGQIGTVNVPKQIYQLTHNYRSHAGILSLASSVLDLMVEFFPESFDRLQKDQGLFHGPRPILLESCSLGDLAILLQGNKRKTSHIEFGAHQAILVVNDSVKNNMPEELSQGVVFTIYEAKGLEFDDVLLYNFFKYSQASKEWRVVTSFLERIANTEEENTNNDNLVTIDYDILIRSKRPRPLTFDPNQHKVLNSEMKHLYTALTRARVNVWIFDEDDEKRAPMFEYFKALKLVRCITQQEMDAIGAMDIIFAEKSTPEDWAKRGDEMMGRCLYEVAAKCYRMGNKETKEKIALAHNQALKASRMKDNPKKMREEFVFAAEKFLESGHDKKAALCLQNAKDYELTGLVFEKCGQLVKAAKMYRRCKKHLDESRCYEQLGNYHKAVEVLDNVELYDQAIDCLKGYMHVVSEYEEKGQEVPQVLLSNKPSITVAQLSFKAANFYHKYKNESKMIEALERLPRVEDRLDFLKNRGYVEQAANILMTQGDE